MTKFTIKNITSLYHFTFIGLPMSIITNKILTKRSFETSHDKTCIELYIQTMIVNIEDADLYSNYDR